MEVKVLKSNGEQELFDRDKLRNSLKRSGASFVLVNEITDKIEEELASVSADATGGDKNSPVETEYIYKKAFEYLESKEKKTAKRYSLRRGVLKMGPTGFPFEQFIAKILQQKGYKTQNGVMLAGKCVEHEIDVMAYDDDDLVLVEVKFHNDLHIKTDTKVALYVKARYEDLSEAQFSIDGKSRPMTNGIMVTNTKFTNNARKYARCADLGLISWDYPKRGNLYDLIEESGIDPAEFAESIKIK